MALTNHIVSDSPTNNFATLNPLSTAGSTATPITISDGNLKTVHSVTGQWQGAKGTISVSSGIWYFEVVILQVPTGTTQNYNIGFYNADIHNDLYYLLAGNLTFGAYGDVAQLFVNTSNTAYGSLGSNGSIYMFCLDVDSEKFWVGLNGSWFASGNPSTGVNPSASGFGKANWTTVQSDYTYSGAGSFQHNYGQDPTFAGNKSPSTTYTDANGIGAFYYPPPTDALALCTANLPDFTPDVDDDTPQDYFKAVTYTGNGTGQSITSVGFQPDLVWIKMRNNSAANANQSTSHVLSDSVRGILNFLITNSTNDEYTSADGYTNTSNLTSYNPDGFSVGTELNFNGNGDTYVAWCWKAGGNSNTFNINGTGYSTYSALQTANTSLPASSTSGMIVPSGMSINTDAGFSIFKYEGVSPPTSSTLPHGLSKTPEFVIIKGLSGSGTTSTGGSFNMSSGSGWLVNHVSTGLEYSRLDTTALSATYTNMFKGVGSSYITIGVDSWLNCSGVDYIMYCWHSVEDYSKFGSYTGNGSANGPFVYTGFRPAFVVVKNTDITSTNWMIWDSARDSYNETDSILRANTPDFENDGTWKIDFLSNGFKLRTVSSDHVNSSTAYEYIYMAFAEQPFKFSNAR
jgi:hypothetical protein